jgi:hypothetical protein
MKLLRTLVAAGVALLAPVVLLALLVTGAAPAGAHGDAGLIEIEAAHPTATGTHYIVRLTYQNDGDPVVDATVTATPAGPDGRELSAVELTPYDDDGRYQVAIDQPEPGSWTVTFASAEPEASAETTTEVTATTTTDAGSTDGTEAGFAPSEDGTGDSATAEGDDSDDGFPILIVVAAAVVAVGGLFTALRIIRRNRPTPEP